MSESPSTLSRNLRRGGLLVLLVLLALLAWWLWPAGKAPSGAGGLGGPGTGPARFGFGGPVPVRVAPVTRGDFPIEIGRAHV